MKFAAAVALMSLPAAFAGTCEELASLKLPDATVTAAQSFATGAFVPAAPAGKGKNTANPFADLPAFCRVAVTIKPTSDSDIKVEFWLPTAATWNGKFEANGNGGWSGSITPATLATGVRLGYASAMSDLGHEGGNASFALGHPEKVIDFGYRSTHEMALKGKALVQAFYGSAPKHSFFNGCSAGGRQGLMEAQRFPNDFDGIVAGSPGLNWSGRAVQAVWVGQATHKEEGSMVPAAKFAAIHKAALEACDALDGAKDGIIDNPRKCKFDPKTIECKGADEATCLTAPQVEAVRKIYSDVTNPRTKAVLFERHEPGSELGWNTMAGAQPFAPGTDLFRYVVFENPDWDYKTFNFDSDMEKTLKASASMNAMNTDLAGFYKQGGKLIQYHGWSDPQISPGSSMSYYESVAKANGGISRVQQNHRLFLVPGMAHCGGGEATANFDMLKALEGWVEQGKAPDRVEASRVVNGQTDRTRPLCPYPQSAVYSGSGSVNESANFACKVP